MRGYRLAGFVVVTMNRLGLNISLSTNKRNLERRLGWDDHVSVPRLGYSVCWAYSDKNAILLILFVSRLACFKRIFLRYKSLTWPPMTMSCLENPASLLNVGTERLELCQRKLWHPVCFAFNGEKHSHSKCEYCYKKKTYLFKLHVSSIPRLILEQGN